MLCRVTVFVASIALLGGCAMKAPRLAANPGGGALTDLGPNSPWYPDHDWLTPDTPQIAGGDGLAELLEDRRVVTRASELARERRRSLGQTLARSSPYRLMVHRELQAQGVPIELASVPTVESAWIPNALGRWVAGLWQFTRDTARAYGLTVDQRVDQRRDPELSTRAAASYLRDLYDRFGRWDLALAGYNAGPARVEQALRIRPGATFFELSEKGLLPETTRRYVPDVLATALVAANPERFGIEGIEALRAARLGRLWNPFG
jgi:membrane-bound lytic murein transglycosylase D